MGQSVRCAECCSIPGFASSGVYWSSSALSSAQCNELKEFTVVCGKECSLCLNDMIDGPGPQMDPELDTIVSQLLKRRLNQALDFLRRGRQMLEINVHELFRIKSFVSITELC